MKNKAASSDHCSQALQYNDVHYTTSYSDRIPTIHWDCECFLNVSIIFFFNRILKTQVIKSLCKANSCGIICSTQCAHVTQFVFAADLNCDKIKLVQHGFCQEEVVYLQQSLSNCHIEKSSAVHQTNVQTVFFKKYYKSSLQAGKVKYRVALCTEMFWSQKQPSVKHRD